MSVRRIERRIVSIETLLGMEDREAQARAIREAFPPLVGAWIEDECAARLGGIQPVGQADPLREAVLAHPLVEAEVQRRLPVLRAWIAWHRAHREGTPAGRTFSAAHGWQDHYEKLEPRDYGNWAWATGAVRVFRRDGARNPEAVALLQAAAHAGVGTEDDERKRRVNLGGRVLADLSPSWASEGARGSDPPRARRKEGL